MKNFASNSIQILQQMNNQPFEGLALDQPKMYSPEVAFGYNDLLTFKFLKIFNSWYVSEAYCWFRFHGWRFYHMVLREKLL